MINENLLRIYESLSQLMLCSTDEAVNNALFLLEHIAEENQNSVVVSRGDSKEIFNSCDFFQNIAQVLGMSDKYQKESSLCYKRANLYQGELHPEVVEKNRTLYSFRAINDYSLHDLVNQTITVVSPLLMNDPSDILLYDWVNARELKIKSFIDQNGFKNKPVVQQILKSSSLFRDALKYYRIRSFSARSEDGKYPYENTLMWSHYANSHKGICIEYSLSKDFQAKRMNNGYLCTKSVIYSNEKIDLNSEEEFSGEKSLFYKSKDWAYENEVRMLTYMSDIEGDVYSLPLDSASGISAIYFGLDCNEDYKKIIMDIMKNNNIQYFNIEKDYTNIYKLKRNLITRRY